MTTTALLTPAEISARWKVKVDAVRELIHLGKLPAINVGLGTKKGRFRVDPDDLAKYEASRRIQPPLKPGRKPRQQRPEGWRDFAAEHERKRGTR